MKYGFRPDRCRRLVLGHVLPSTPRSTSSSRRSRSSGSSRASCAGTCTASRSASRSLAAVALVYLDPRQPARSSACCGTRACCRCFYLMRYLLMMVGVVEVRRGRRQLRPQPAAPVTCRRSAASRSVLVAGVGARRAGHLRLPVPGAPVGGHVTKHGEAVRLGAVPRAPIRNATADAAATAGRLQLQRLRGSRRTYPEYYDVVQTMADIGEDQRVRPGAVGEQPHDEQRPVRHDDGADAAAVLDRRLHRLDGGAVLRGVGHHAVPLPHRRRRCRKGVQPGAPSCATSTTTPRSACRVPAGARRPIPDGHAPPRRVAQAEAQPELTEIAESGPWRIYRSPTPTIVEPLERPAGGRRTAATATSASATSSSARRGSSTRTTGRRCRPTDGPDEWQRIDVVASRHAATEPDDDR